MWSRIRSGRGMTEADDPALLDRMTSWYPVEQDHAGPEHLAAAYVAT